MRESTQTAPNHVGLVAMSSRIGKASVLAVGTELTTGQIVNRNASWLSEKLTSIGVEVILHETVADDRPRIHEALDRCSEIAQWIFITGGLGPTTDDFTREVIAEWANLPLKFDEPSWLGILTRLSSIGIPVAESNRQQCYFPQGAKILANPEGTAAGFYFSNSRNEIQTQIWALPGPPQEVAAIWNQEIEPTLRQLSPEFKPTQLLTWQCMGKSEAELGEITEKALSGSGLQTGYRAHRPIVEVKVWCDPKEMESKRPWLDQLQRALAPWLLTVNGEDLAQRLLKKLAGFDCVDLIDQATSGALAQRIGSLLKSPQHQELSKNLTLLTEWKAIENPAPQVQAVLEEADPEVLTLILSGYSIEGQAAIGLKWGSKTLQAEIKSPYPHPKWLDRTRPYALEMALKIWSEWLSAWTH